MMSRVLHAAVFTALGLAVCSPALAAAPNGADCKAPASELESWKTFVARELYNHDPAHAARMSKVAAAILYGRVDIVQGELKAGLDPNTLLKLSAKTAGYTTLLTLAAAACQNRVAQQLVDAGASVKPTDPPLATAAAKGDVALAAFLIEKGAPIDQVDPAGNTPLYNALAQSQLGMVKLLLAKGANPDIPLARAFVKHTSASSTATNRAISDELRKYLHSKH